MKKQREGGQLEDGFVPLCRASLAWGFSSNVKFLNKTRRDLCSKASADHLNQTFFVTSSFSPITLHIIVCDLTAHSIFAASFSGPRWKWINNLMKTVWFPGGTFFCYIRRPSQIQKTMFYYVFECFCVRHIFRLEFLNRLAGNILNTQMK